MKCSMWSDCGWIVFDSKLIFRFVWNYSCFLFNLILTCDIWFILDTLHFRVTRLPPLSFSLWSPKFAFSSLLVRPLHSMRFWIAALFCCICASCSCGVDWTCFAQVLFAWLNKLSRSWRRLREPLPKHIRQSTSEITGSPEPNPFSCL